ncbi:hypothetical protein BaRGS_00021617, partial [Batillaria attramentaria]
TLLVHITVGSQIGDVGIVGAAQQLRHLVDILMDVETSGVWLCEAWLMAGSVLGRFVVWVSFFSPGRQVSGSAGLCALDSKSRLRVPPVWSPVTSSRLLPPLPVLIASVKETVPAVNIGTFRDVVNFRSVVYQTSLAVNNYCNHNCIRRHTLCCHGSTGQHVWHLKEQGVCLVGGTAFSLTSTGQ